MRRLLLLLLLLIGPAWGDGFPLKWPPLPGFRSETIPFPLSFAPELPYRGMEELRFAPGFGNPQAPDFFSYVFVWLIEDTLVVDEARLQTDLTAYFRGLMKAVHKGEPPVASTVRLQKGAGNGFASPSFTGTAVTWDAFFTKQPLELQIDVFEPPCPWAVERYQHLLYFEVSPRLREERVRSVLQGARAGLQLR